MFFRITADACCTTWTGPEFYHQAHKQFHPTYRAILYERNYYDIFMFDLQGRASLIDSAKTEFYSVQQTDCARQSDLFGLQGRFGHIL